VRKINIPFMGRYIGALGEIAQVAEITLIYYLFIIGHIDTVYFQSFAFIHEVEQSWKCIAEADTTSAAMADVIDAL